MTDETDAEAGDNIISWPLEPWVQAEIIKSEDQICTPDECIEAQIGQMSNVVLMGFDKNGEFLLASSLKRVSDINTIVDGAKIRLMRFIE